jgi:hypothetical protein
MNGSTSPCTIRSIRPTSVKTEGLCLATLLNGIKSGKITEVYADDYFNTKKTLKDMSSSFKYVDTTQAGIDEINNYYDDYKKGQST